MPLSSDDREADGGDSLEADLADYDALVARLDQHRWVALDPSADQLFAGRKRLYWITYDGDVTGQLHSGDRTLGRGGAVVDYQLALPDDGETRASDQIVITAQRSGGEIVYRAYDGQAGASLDEAHFAEPPDEQRYWAFAVDGRRVYIAVTTEDTTLWLWHPGEDQPAPLLTFAALGVAVGIFQDFMVWGDRLLAVESGRLWSVDLARGEASWLPSMSEVTGPISVDDRGVLYTTADGPLYQANTGGPVRDLAAEIAAASYRLNHTFADAHLFSADAVLASGHATPASTAAYIGQTGIFAFDLDSREVTPLLLEPRAADLRLVYVDPIALEDGTLFVTGLESDDGAVGADGPVYGLRPGAP